MSRSSEQRRQRAAQLRAKHADLPMVAAMTRPAAPPAVEPAQPERSSRRAVQRPERALERLAAARVAYDRAKAARDEAMMAGLAAGLSPAAVGRALGISRQAVNQRVAILGRA